MKLRGTNEKFVLIIFLSLMLIICRISLTVCPQALLFSHFRYVLHCVCCSLIFFPLLVMLFLFTFVFTSVLTITVSQWLAPFLPFTHFWHHSSTVIYMQLNICVNSSMVTYQQMLDIIDVYTYCIWWRVEGMCCKCNSLFARSDIR